MMLRSRCTGFSGVQLRLSSTSALTYTSKPLPEKAHHHRPIPDSSFPHGYSVSGQHCGIKKSGAPDLGYILSTSPHPTSAAACFTRNAFQAAPVLVSRDVLAARAGRARAVVVNSGCANAVTGATGLENAWAMARATDALLPRAPHTDEPSEALVLSTGVIGQQLPISRILAALENEKRAPSGGSGFVAWERIARAFMTTDTFPKLRAREFSVRGRTYRLAGIDKGAGMIHPDMAPAAVPAAPHATLLGCIATDAPVTPRSLQNALAHAVDRSFNAISVDGDMSTNDTVLLLANGAAHGTEETPVEIDEDTDPEAYLAFRDALTNIAAELAQLVVRDGEGATKFVTVTVKGAPSYSDAHKVASRVSTSALVKTALYGEDANWGRILAATGAIPLSVPIDPTQVSVSFIPSDGSVPLRVLIRGEPETVDEVRAAQILAEGEFGIDIELGLGSESAQFWTCDFSYEYVRINGDYRS